jgi:integrase/recombinase XerD
VFLAAQRRPNTAEAYRRDLNQFLGWCAEVHLAPLDAEIEDLERYRTRIEGLGLADSTIARKLAALGSYYRRLHRQKLIPELPTQYLDRPAIDVEAQSLGLTVEQMQALLVAASDAGPHEYALVRVLFYNGLRISEAVSLDSVDITTDGEHFIAKVGGKGGKTETITLNAGTHTALMRAHVARRGTPTAGDERDAIFVLSSSPPFRRLDRFEAYALIQKLGAAAELPRRLTPHDLRHTFVTLSLEAGQDLRQVQTDARHRDPKTTERYDKARKNRDKHSTHALLTLLEGDAQDS